MRERTARRYPIVARIVDWAARSRICHVIAEWERFASCSRLVRECRRSPGGYRAMHLVYEHEPAGDSLLERVAEWYFLTAPFATAARMRLAGTVAWLKRHARRVLTEKGRLGVLSLACGGAHDGIEAFAGMPGRGKIDFLGIDVDDEALVFAGRRAAGVGLGHFRFRKQDARRPDPGWKDRFDLILAVGLFHYLSEDEVKRTLARIHDVLPAGGRLLFDAASRNPSRRFFENKLHWHLEYYEIDRILSLARASPFGAAQLFRNCMNCFLLVECVK